MKKVFTILITIVICLAYSNQDILNLDVKTDVNGNTVMPNVVDQAVMAVEDSIFNATGFSFDIDGNGRAGSASSGSYTAGTTGNATDDNTAGVEGYFN